jgi:hypothetical protein
MLRKTALASVESSTKFDSKRRTACTLVTRGSTLDACRHAIAPPRASSCCCCGRRRRRGPLEIPHLRLGWLLQAPPLQAGWRRARGACHACACAAAAAAAAAAASIAAAAASLHARARNGHARRSLRRVSRSQLRLRADTLSLDASTATVTAAVDVAGAPHLDLYLHCYASGIARLRLAESDGKPPRWQVRAAGGARRAPAPPLLRARARARADGHLGAAAAAASSSSSSSRPILRSPTMSCSSRGLRPRRQCRCCPRRTR